NLNRRAFRSQVRPVFRRHTLTSVTGTSPSPATPRDSGRGRPDAVEAPFHSLLPCLSRIAPSQRLRGRAFATGAGRILRCRRTIERKPGNILTRRGIFLPTPFNFAASCATVAPMIAYAAQRLASLFLTLVAATVIIFLVLEVLPGDPAEIMLGLNAQPDTVAALRHELGLDRPALLRYLDWVGG